MAISKTLKDIIEPMLRVDQAGEYGAVRIYEGQLKTVSDPHKAEKKALIKKTLEEEQNHLNVFNEWAAQQEIRPTFAQPLWHIGGYTLGLVTGLLGDKAVHACTQAVEEVIVDHYQQQAKELNKALDLCRTEEEKAVVQNLINTIDNFCADEQAHRDEAVLKGASQAPAYSLMLKGIKAITRTAIAISKRI